MSREALSWLVALRGLRPIQRLVLGELCWIHRPDEEASIYPSTKYLAERLETTPRTVRRALEELEKRGLIRRVPRHDGEGRQQSNTFELALDRPLPEGPKQFLRGGRTPLSGGADRIDRGGGRARPGGEDNTSALEGGEVVVSTPSGRRKGEDPLDRYEVPPELDYPEARSLLRAWIEHRRKLRIRPYKTSAWIGELAGWSLERLDAAIRHSMAKEYQGIFEPNGAARTPELGVGGPPVPKPPPLPEGTKPRWVILYEEELENPEGERDFVGDPEWDRHYDRWKADNEVGEEVNDEQSDSS